LAFVVLAGGACIVILFRSDLIRLFAGTHAPDAFGVLLFALAAQVVSGSTFWNSAFLIAATRADLASRSYLVMAALLAVLLPTLTSWFGATGAAAALFAGVVVVNVRLTLAALALIRTAHGSGRTRANGEVPTPG
jgi:O-antigen/teichoic acid export membrane protein